MTGQKKLELKTKAIAFAKEELNEDIIKRDAEGNFSKVLWKKCTVHSILNLASELNGEKVSFLDLIITREGYIGLDNGLA